MKKIQLLLLAFALTYSSLAQVAISTTGNAPHASAMLDIQGSHKGLLIPRVWLQSTVDNATIPNPAPTLLLWNSNAALPGGTGYYFNGGTAASPNWKPLQDIVLPLNKSVSTDGAAFTIANYSQNAASSAIKAVAGGNGNALEVVGKMKIAGGGQTPAAGKILTSDAEGNATWEGAVAFSVVGARFDGAGDFANGVEKKIPFLTEVYDLGNNYNDSYTSPHSTFTVPVKGIYHFDVQVAWINADESGNYYVNLFGLSNGSQWSIARSEIKDADLLEHHISIDVLLNAGDQVYVGALQTSGSTQSIDWSTKSMHFNGRLVIKL
jgi:hypothetical protein